MANEQTFSEPEIIHLMTAPYDLQLEWLKKSSINSHLNSTYHAYMANAYEPEKRDYPLLRYVLSMVQHIYRAKLENVLMMTFDRANINPYDVKYVYDLGCGESLWWKILLEQLPNIEVMYCVDKTDSSSQPTHPKVERICGRVEDFLETLQCREGVENLYFMSEWLHCKEDNLKILYHTKLRQSNVIVNEINNDMFLDYRLRQTGGHILNPTDIEREAGSKQTSWTIERYVAYFRYFMMGISA